MAKGHCGVSSSGASPRDLRYAVKCLVWEDNGFVLYYKSLAEERFKWPKPDDEVISLTGIQINWLLDGYDLALMKGHKTLRYESIF
jgi:transposase